MYTQDDYAGEKLMNLYILNDVEEIYTRVSEKIANLILNNPKAHLGLATGSTPIGVYRKLIEKHQNEGISFKQVKTFNLDEYIGLPANHPQSYAYFMSRNLFSHVDIEKENTHIPSGNVHNIQNEIKRYDTLLNQNRIDIQLLGLGTNGHIGFNEPGTSFTSTTHIIKLDQSTRQANARFFKDLAEVPTEAITMGIHTIMKAKEIILIATGETKADAVKKMITGPIDESLPASILQTHPNVHIYLDRSSAKEL